MLHTIAIVNACVSLLTEACIEHEVDFDLARDAALRYVARASLSTGDCEEHDLIAAVAAPIGGLPDPLYMRVFKAVADTFDEVVVWSDEHGRDGRYIVSTEVFYVSARPHRMAYRAVSDESILRFLSQRALRDDPLLGPMSTRQILSALRPGSTDGFRRLAHRLARLRRQGMLDSRRGSGHFCMSEDMWWWLTPAGREAAGP